MPASIKFTKERTCKLIALHKLAMEMKILCFSGLYKKIIDF
jgi:hypothetical protein